jgi:hypothetical protein
VAGHPVDGMVITKKKFQICHSKTAVSQFPNFDGKDPDLDPLNHCCGKTLIPTVL